MGGRAGGVGQMAAHLRQTTDGGARMRSSSWRKARAGREEMAWVEVGNGTNGRWSTNWGGGLGPDKTRRSVMMVVVVMGEERKRKKRQ